jgi:hypothetical protein
MARHVQYPNGPPDLHQCPSHYFGPSPSDHRVVSHLRLHPLIPHPKLPYSLEAGCPWPCDEEHVGATMVARMALG